MHGTEAPSSWVQRWTHLIPPHATALDLACGAGRHMRWLKAQGLQVTGVDRSPEAIAACAAGQVQRCGLGWNQMRPSLDPGRGSFRTVHGVLLLN